MKRGLFWIGVAAVVAAAAWLAIRPTGVSAPDGGPDGPLALEGDGAPAAAGTAGAGAAGASLAKTDPSRASRARAIGASRGAGAIVGVVRRDGRPVAASVEVIHTGDVAPPRGFR